VNAPVGWDDPRTARAYERFCRRHSRYRAANDALVAHAALAPGHRVLDVAAGTGRTAEAVLPYIGATGTVLCVEPARAMRETGASRIRDSRVTWTDELPEPGVVFDRVVCGAGIWQLLPLDAAVDRLSAHLAPGGALVFNIPAAYLPEQDPLVAGRDPFFVELIARVDRSDVAPAGPGDFGVLPRSGDEVHRMLTASGLRAERWSFELRLTEAAYRDWLKIPPVSDGLLGGLTPDERARRLDDAYHRTDRHSWRRERWIGWTAWRAC
jgi:SAM-dependent methyltransferase